MSLQGYPHVEEIEDCKCDDCQGGRKKKKKTGTATKKKRAVKGKKGSKSSDEGTVGLSDEAFTAAQASIAAAKEAIFGLMRADSYRRYVFTEEGAAELKQKFPDAPSRPGTVQLREQMLTGFCTAVPEKKGTWGAWDPNTHLEAFKVPSKKVGYYHSFFTHCKGEYSPENIMFFTACRQLESLESNRSKYFALFDEIYKTFIGHQTPLEINLGYEEAAAIQNVITKYRFIPTDGIHRVDAARRAARKALYETLFNSFRAQKAYKNKEDKHVDRFDAGPNAPNPNIDYWFDDDKKGFKDLKKFAKKSGKAFVNLLDFYNACCALQETPNQDKFIEICEKYILPDSDNRVEGIGSVLMDDLGFEYMLTAKTPARSAGRGRGVQVLSL